MERNHFEVLLENMDSKFQLVLEGHDVLRGEIIKNREKIVHLGVGTSAIEMAIGRMKDRRKSDNFGQRPLFAPFLPL